MSVVEYDTYLTRLWLKRCLICNKQFELISSKRMCHECETRVLRARINRNDVIRAYSEQKNIIDSMKKF